MLVILGKWIKLYDCSCTFLKQDQVTYLCRHFPTPLLFPPCPLELRGNGYYTPTHSQKFWQEASFPCSLHLASQAPASLLCFLFSPLLALSMQLSVSSTPSSVTSRDLKGFTFFLWLFFLLLFHDFLTCDLCCTSQICVHTALACVMFPFSFV